MRIDADGSMVSESVPAAQAQEHMIADYTCRTQYPPDPATYQPFNRAQLELWYEHMTTTLSDCIEKLGYPVEEPPSLATWIAAYDNATEGNMPWHPTDLVPDSAKFTIQSECSNYPDNIYDLATGPR